jgi:hypothetical protein
MIIHFAKVPMDFDLLLPGDIHKGTTLMNKSGVDNLLERLKKKNTYMIFMGDAVDAISVTDKRYESDLSDGSTPIEQADWIVEKFLPFRGKILAWLSGNHERSVKSVGDIVKSNICDKLKVPYGTFSCRIEFENNNGVRLFSGMFHHGDGQINSSHPDPMVRQAMMTYKLKCKLEPFGGDCMLNAMGHTHKLLIYKPIKELFLKMDLDGKLVSKYTQPYKQINGYIDPCQRWYVNTGSFQKLYSKTSVGSGYAERAMYAPVELGYPIVHVRNGFIQDIVKEFV